MRCPALEYETSSPRERCAGSRPCTAGAVRRQMVSGCSRVPLDLMLRRAIPGGRLRRPSTPACFSRVQRSGPLLPVCRKRPALRPAVQFPTSACRPPGPLHPQMNRCHGTRGPRGEHVCPRRTASPAPEGRTGESERTKPGVLAHCRASDSLRVPPPRADEVHLDGSRRAEPPERGVFLRHLRAPPWRAVRRHRRYCGMTVAFWPDPSM